MVNNFLVFLSRSCNSDFLQSRNETEYLRRGIAHVLIALTRLLSLSFPYPPFIFFGYCFFHLLMLNPVSF